VFKFRIGDVAIPVTLCKHKHKPIVAMIFSLLKISAESGDGNANLTLMREGFIGERGTRQIHKWGRPDTGNRFVLDIDLIVDKAGTFRMLRQKSDGWEEVYKGRITGSESNDSKSTNIFNGVVPGTFNRASFLTPIDPLCEDLNSVPRQLFAKDEEEEDEEEIIFLPDGSQIYKSQIVVEVETNLIRRFPEQPRLEFDPVKLEELGQSILSVGQLKPIDLYKIPEERLTDDGCIYEISYDGERRWIMCTRLGIKVKALISDKPPPDGVERFARSFVSNLHAVTHTPYEMAKGIMYMHRKTGDVAQVYQILGVSLPTIYNYLKLRSLHPELLEKMRKEVPRHQRLRMEHAKELAEVVDQEQQMVIYKEAYGQAERGMKTVTRIIGDKVSAAETTTKRKPGRSQARRSAARSIQNLISATASMAGNVDGVKRHILLGTEADRQELEESLETLQRTIPDILEIVKSLAPK
jgi:ParB/RepB/Spo0J family partition protein